MSFFKRLLVVMVYLLSLLVVGALGFAALIVFAGPHSDILPDELHGLVVLIVVIAVILVPVFLARLTLAKLRQKEEKNQ